MCDIVRLDNDRKATVVAVDLVHVFVICPYCGKIHLHGSNGLLDGDNGNNTWSHRLDHCGAHYNAGYYLVGNQFTVKSEKPLTSKQALKKYHKAIGVIR